MEFVITGAPGAGKSTLINYLKQKGYNMLPEIYTTTVEKALAEGTDEQLFSDPLEMQCLLIRKQLEAESQLNKKDVVFLDRSIIDIIVFCKDRAINLPQDVLTMAQTSCYDMAFFLEPLPESLYALQLKMRNKYALCTRDESVKLARLLRNEYEKRGIQCISVPFDTTEKMSMFIENTVNIFNA